jgi:hypothetical protein
MTLDEILNGGGNISHLEIAPPAQFVSHVFGNVLRPSLFGVEGHDADWGAVLPRKEILNNGFQVGGFLICFAPGATQFSKILRDKINGFTAVSGYDRGCPTGSLHTQLRH